MTSDAVPSTFQPEPGEIPPGGAEPRLFPRRLGDIQGGTGGPTLVCVAGIHGNEPAGVYALQRVLARLEDNPNGLQGRLVGLTGNRPALAAGRRFLESDLNRTWLPERLIDLQDAQEPLAAENREMAELGEEIDAILDCANGDTYVLDLHSTSGQGSAFVTLDDTLPNRRMAFAIPLPHVLGLEEEISGTLLSYLIGRGVTAVGFECGQHEDPESVRRAAAAIWLLLERVGILEEGTRLEVQAARDRLTEEGKSFPAVVEVRYRHAVVEGDGFQMAPGFANFQPAPSGQRLAWHSGAEITAPFRSLVLMPLYQKQGEDGFFLVRPVRRFWLRISALMRRLRMQRVVHWLPGVSRDAEIDGAFRVNRRVARLFAGEIFHLLGYRRHGLENGQLIVVPRGRNL